MKTSISRIKLFKCCRKAYEFKYLEKLEPIQKAEALEVGTNYHAKLEEIYNNGYCDISDYSKESAMAFAYEKHIFPTFKMKKAEEWFEYKLQDGYTLVGRVDGITEDGILVEHKTTSSANLDEYEYDLQWDEQILAYMLGYGVRKMWYTIIKKPTIRQKKDESDEEFFDRMCKWYDEDTDSKIRVILIERTSKQIEEFRKSLFEMTRQIEEAERNRVELYRNPNYCNSWGRRCEYASICLNYDPTQEYVEFTKGE